MSLLTFCSKTLQRNVRRISCKKSLNNVNLLHNYKFKFTNNFNYVSSRKIANMPNPYEFDEKLSKRISQEQQFVKHDELPTVNQKGWEANKGALWDSRDSELSLRSVLQDMDRRVYVVFAVIVFSRHLFHFYNLDEKNATSRNF